MLYCIILYCVIFIILCCIILCYINYIMLYYIVLYCIVLYLLYYVVLYYIILYYIILYYYNLMGPPSFMRSVVDRNVVMRRIPVLATTVRQLEEFRLLSVCAKTSIALGNRLFL